VKSRIANLKLHLVTGGAGFVGSQLVRRLINSGYRVRVLDNQFRGSFDRLKDLEERIDFFQADIRDRDSVLKATEDVKCIWHLASINGTRYFYTEPDLVLDVGVRGFLNVLDACIEKKVPELMLASSSEVYQTPPQIPTNESVPMSIPDPLNPRYSYATAKIASEIMALNYGRKYFKRVIIFRPHNVYGPDMGWEHVIPQMVLRMRTICKKTNKSQIKFPIQGTGKETRAFVFIDDFIDGLMILLERGEHLGIYNIGTTEEVTMEHLAKETGKYFGREIEIVPGEPAKGGTPRRCPDISKISALGYRPKCKLSNVLPLVIKWYDENAGKAPEVKE